MCIQVECCLIPFRSNGEGIGEEKGKIWRMQIWGVDRSGSTWVPGETSMGPHSARLHLRKRLKVADNNKTKPMPEKTCNGHAALQLFRLLPYV